jgi:hypothetical protein
VQMAVRALTAILGGEGCAVLDASAVVHVAVVNCCAGRIRQSSTVLDASGAPRLAVRGCTAFVFT